MYLRLYNLCTTDEGCCMVAETFGSLLLLLVGVKTRNNKNKKQKQRKNTKQPKKQQMSMIIVWIHLLKRQCMLAITMVRIRLIVDLSWELCSWQQWKWALQWQPLPRSTPEQHNHSTMSHNRTPLVSPVQVTYISFFHFYMYELIRVCKLSEMGGVQINRVHKVLEIIQ